MYFSWKINNFTVAPKIPREVETKSESRITPIKIAPFLILMCLTSESLLWTEVRLGEMECGAI